jgi:hypothetical protein
MNVELRLDKAGTLNKPRIIGRTVRFLLGAACAWYVYDLVSHYGYFVGMDVPRLLEDIPWLLSVLFAFHVFPYIVNIGFSRDWRRRPQLGIIVLAIVTGVIGIIQYGSFWAPPLGWLIVVWLIYVYGHLGTSMLVAAMIGTPGCEMRAIPHLWTIVSGRQTAEHYCPGFLNRLDKWESSKQE